MGPHVSQQDERGADSQLANEASPSRATIAAYLQYVNPAFVRLLGVFGYGRVFVRARDVWIWDDTGREYLDCLAGFGSVNIGHNHPRLLDRLQRFLREEALNFCHVGPSPHTAELAKAIASRCADPLSISLFSSSGAEAVEAGMKLARAATGRSGFLFCAGGFHGTNLGSLSVMGATRLRTRFEPLLEGCQSVPFGDLTAIESALRSRKHAAWVVEPIQAEAGVILPPPGYLAEAQKLCRKYGTLLVLDEVQTGLGRTGTMFAYESQGFVPDVLVLAKSLSGSIAPIGATVTSPEIHKRAYGSVDRFDLHSSTFGGNALSCVAARETLDILADEQLIANSAERGRQLLDALRKRLSDHPLVRDIRGCGLLVGVELGPGNASMMQRIAAPLVEMISRHVFGQWVALRLLEQGIICQPASQQWNVLKIEPPLTIAAEQIDRVVDSLASVLEDYERVTPLLRDVAGRLLRQFSNGWSF